MLNIDLFEEDLKAGKHWLHADRPKGDATALADWVEDLHPRATDGKFAPAGGGGEQTAATATGALGHGLKLVKSAELSRDVRHAAGIEGDTPLNPNVAAGLNAAMDTLKATSPKIYEFMQTHVPFASVAYEPNGAAMTTVSGPSFLVMLVNGKSKSDVLEGKGFDKGWTVAGTATAADGTTGGAKTSSLYRGLLFHEIGHVVDAYSDRALTEQLTTMVRTKFEGSLQARDWIKQNISGYAATNPRDAVAESVAKVLLGQKLPSELKFIEEFVHAK